MTLTVEDGTGLANADSYLSEANADTFLAALGWTAWAAATSPNKEIALRKATRFVDDAFGPQAKGVRIVDTMSLQWPRIGVYDRDGYYVATDAVPQQVKDSCALAAVLALSTELIPSSITAAAAIHSYRVKVDTIEEETVYGGSGDPQETIYPEILRRMSTLLRPSLGVMRA